MMTTLRPEGGGIDDTKPGFQLGIRAVSVCRWVCVGSTSLVEQGQNKHVHKKEISTEDCKGFYFFLNVRVGMCGENYYI